MIRLIIEYIFIVNLIEDITIDNFFYKLGLIYKSLICSKPRIVFFLDGESSRIDQATTATKCNGQISKAYMRFDLSTLTISTSSTPKMHLKLKSQSCATDKRFKLRFSTSNTFEMDMSFETAIFPRPLAFPLPLSPNIILS